MKNRYIIFSALGIELVGIILGCLYLGQLVDQKYNLGGLGIAIIPMLGLAGWLFQVVKLAQRIEHQNKKDGKEG